MTEDKRFALLQQLVNLGEATPPVEHGMPDLELELVPELDSLSDLLIADRDKERCR